MWRRGREGGRESESGGGRVERGSTESHCCLLLLPPKAVYSSPHATLLTASFQKATVRFNNATAFSNFQCWLIMTVHFKLQQIRNLFLHINSGPFQNYLADCIFLHIFRTGVQIHATVIACSRKREDFSLGER